MEKLPKIFYSHRPDGTHVAYSPAKDGSTAIYAKGNVTEEEFKVIAEEKIKDALINQR